MSALVRTEGMDQEVPTITKDVSAGGAYLQNISTLKKNVQVKIELIIGNETVKKLTGSLTRIKICGKVIRCSSDGVAVRFQDNYEILPFRSHMNH